MNERPLTRKGSGLSLGRPAKRHPYCAVASFAFARLVRASRGTRPLPLHPLPSSLCSVFKKRTSMSHVTNP